MHQPMCPRVMYKLNTFTMNGLYYNDSFWVVSYILNTSTTNIHVIGAGRQAEAFLRHTDGQTGARQACG